MEIDTRVTALTGMAEREGMRPARMFITHTLLDDGIVVLTINRPPANALDPELLAESEKIVARLQADLPAAVVITGTDGFFSGGVDLKVVPHLDLEGQQTMMAGVNRLFTDWYGIECPVVAAVNGHAVAGGLILALCADRRIAAPDGRFALTELAVGIPYPAAAMAVVTAELGAPDARNLVLGADLVDAQAALAMRLVDEIVPTAECLDRALVVARQLAALPAGTYRRVKRELRAGTLETMRASVDRAAPEPWLSDETAAASADRLKQD